jgi:iron-sulfur cluster repair protein YtfE (RIC family)
MKPTPTFASLSRIHGNLDSLFKSHQRSLLARDINAAMAALSKFGSDLETHIRFEEERLMPLYADQGGEAPGATIEIFQAEHRKLRDDVAKLIRRTESLSSAPDLPDAILELLTDEAGFKGLLHHHLTREEKHLFPRLDERATEDERKTWLAEG